MASIAIIITYMWPLTRKRSLGMNSRQANAQQAHYEKRIAKPFEMEWPNRCTDAVSRMKKLFAQMQSNGYTADENFWTDAVENFERMRSNG